MGYLASFHSCRRDSVHAVMPKIIRQITSAEFQGALTPPVSRPIRNIRVPPIRRRVPTQSMLRRPASRGVLGDEIRRKRNMISSDIPPIGTVWVSFPH